MKNIRFLGRIIRISWNILGEATKDPNNPDWEGWKQRSSAFIDHEYDLMVK